MWHACVTILPVGLFGSLGPPGLDACPRLSFRMDALTWACLNASACLSASCSWFCNLSAGMPRQKQLLRVPGARQGWDIDCVVPVPDGSRPAAIQISAELGLPYREGLVKNRYVGRTFIMPDQRSAPCRMALFFHRVIILSPLYPNDQYLRTTVTLHRSSPDIK